PVRQPTPRAVGQSPILAVQVGQTAVPDVFVIRISRRHARKGTRVADMEDLSQQLAVEPGLQRINGHSRIKVQACKIDAFVHAAQAGECEAVHHDEVATGVSVRRSVEWRLATGVDRNNVGWILHHLWHEALEVEVGPDVHALRAIKAAWPRALDKA